MIDLTHDPLRNKIRRWIELDNETPTTTYVDEHKCLTALYFDYILMKYPAENEAQAKIEREMNDRCFVERQK